VTRRRTIVAAAAIAALVATTALPLARAWWWWRESNPVRRGARLAGRVGCLSCHGPAGTHGLPDPALGQEVPAWDGGVAMMYVSGPDEVREYILDGTTRRRAASGSAREARARAAIRMPAFRDVLSGGEVEDLVAYFMAASRSAPLADARLARGRDLVATLRCEACHGVGGSGGVPNPGSFKGYVPGWLGPDFEDLVRSDTELKAWIFDGKIDRFEQNVLAQYFLGRQRLKMPAYKAALTPEDGDALIAYLRSLRTARR
jgi:mono/diheme cytochrome c family protein